MEDLQIIDMYFARNEAAIRETDKKYGRLCFSVAYNILVNREDSEECVSDSLFAIWNSIPLQRPCNFRAFLCRITHNLSLKRLDYKLAQKRNAALTVAFDELEAVLADENIVNNITDKAISAVISNFLRKEKAENRNVFIRKYWFFDSVVTIAENYGFS